MPRNLPTTPKHFPHAPARPGALIADLDAALPALRSMGVMMFDPVWAERMHAASGCEMLHVIHGALELQTRGGRYAVHPGDTVLIPKSAAHRDGFDLEQGLEVFFCSFNWEHSDRYFRRVIPAVCLRLPTHRKAEIGSIIHYLRADLAGPGPMDELVARSRVHTILMLILREALRPSPDADQGDYGARRRREIMARARAYLEEHYKECVALDDIADALAISPYYLSHVFSEESDFSLFEYLTSLRMAKAQNLLAQGGANVSQVARAVGYESPNYFAKVFRKRFGAPPTRFAARPPTPQ